MLPTDVCKNIIHVFCYTGILFHKQEKNSKIITYKKMCYIL